MLLDLYTAPEEANLNCKTQKHGTTTSQPTLSYHVGHLLVAGQAEAAVTALIDGEPIVKVVDDWQHLAISLSLDPERVRFQHLVLAGQGRDSDLGDTALADVAAEVVVGRVDKVLATNARQLPGDRVHQFDGRDAVVVDVDLVEDELVEELHPLRPGVLFQLVLLGPFVLDHSVEGHVDAALDAADVDKLVATFDL